MSATTNANQQAARNGNGVVAAAVGIIIGMAFAGYLLKPAPVAHASAPAPVQIDYAAITAAVKAALPPAPAPAAKAAPAPAPAAKAAPVRRKVRKVRAVITAAPAAAPAVYFLAVPRCTCGA